MIDRKEMKREARQALKNHFILFFAVCFIASFLGAEFSGSLNLFTKEVDAHTSGREEGELTLFSLNSMGLTDVAAKILAGKEEEGAELAKEITEQTEKDSQNGNPVLGRTRGVFAQIINAVTSGSILVTVVSAANSLIGSENLTLVFLILSSLFFSFTVWFFVFNLYRVVSRRMFLEGRSYKKVPIQRFLYLLRVKKWSKAAWTMFVTYVFQLLWSLTIVGGVIKGYAYFLVPYIVAENPDIPACEAITLSRRMMKGHKWECFVLGLTFLGWDVLDTFSLGLLGLFFVNPYKVAVYSEYYVGIRGQAKRQGVLGSEQLNDRYLYEKPAQEILDREYQDVAEILSRPEPKLMRWRGVKGFFANYLGILFLSTKEEKEYEECQAEKVRIQALESELEGQAYPCRLYPIPSTQERRRVETLNYMRHYTVWSLILLFFSFAFIGWIWEVSLHLISDGVFVNRGILHGPWLPIYGAGGILILTFLNRFRRYPVAEFFSAVVLCGVVEYGTAWFLEVTHNGQKWWDYSGYFLNLHGRICAEGLLVFGLGGIAIVYVAAPLLDNLFRKIQPRILIPLCVCLVGLFVTDQIYSSKYPNMGEGITACSAPAQPGEKVKREV